MTPMRIAVWGAGSHARNKILPAMAATPGLVLSGVCSRSAEQVSACASTWNCRGWTDASAMLADPDVDVVYVATPIALHAEHGTRVLEAGKHLWCEKPVTGDPAVAERLLQLSRARGLAVCEAHMYLHHPQFRQLRSFVADGRLGAVSTVVCRFGVPKLDDPGFRSHPDLGGGALLDLGCYPVSALLALFPGEACRVTRASIATRDEWMVDTDGVALVECAGGATACLEWRINWSYRNEIDIWGDRGSVFTDRLFSKPAVYVPTFRLRDLRGLETIEGGEAADHFGLMLRDFRQIMDDEVAIERERRRVAERAALLHEIRACAGAGNRREV
jgi:dTDP-3,4-didehydro-2,6-dideoxy-alpha-D-glucose 3-reductase